MRLNNSVLPRVTNFKPGRHNWNFNVILFNSYIRIGQLNVIENRTFKILFYNIGIQYKVYFFKMHFNI